MYSTSLYPPNSSRFSADVISAVVPQRTTPLSWAFDRHGLTPHPHQDHIFDQQQYFQAAPGRADNPQPVTSPSFVTKPNQHRQSPKCSSSSQRNTDVADPVAVAENMFKMRMAEYRQRRRAIKQRYRQRIVKKADRLEEHVARLRQEIQKLEQKQCDIAKGVVQKTTPWKVVADYFRVFRHGYIAPTTQRHEVSCDSPRLHPGDKADVHRRFLQDVVALNVVFNGGRGVEALLEYWGFVSLHHDELNIQLVRMEAGPEGSTIANVHAHTTITANMFGTALLEDAHDCEKETLASKLIGQHLVVPIVPMVVWFGWDSTLDRVVSMLYEADMLTSLLNLLGSVKDVARVLNSPLDFHHCSNRQTHK